jgi:RiboL-PSP-HEPN
VRPSPQFKQLQSRLKKLKKRFLSSRPGGSGQYSEKAKDFARSYRVLAHAEIESYIRSRVEEITMHALKIWQEKRIPHQVVVSLLACWDKDWSDENPEEIPFPNKKKKSDKKEIITVDALVKKAFKAYQNNIVGVYGIRPDHLNEFVMPLGIDISKEDFGTTWLAEMDAFGTQRGRVAHGGESGSRDISPDDDRQRMDNLLPGLKKLDVRFNELMAQVFSVEKQAQKIQQGLSSKKDIAVAQPPTEQTGEGVQTT